MCAFYIIYLFIMWFVIHRVEDLNSNEKIIQYYKKELQLSHTVSIAKKLVHYGTKWYRKNVSYDFPSARRYIRLRALVRNAYKQNRQKCNTLVQLGKIV